MESVNVELARVSAERRRLQKRAHGRDARCRCRRERALRTALIAFCHNPAAGTSIARAILRKYKDCMALDVSECAAELESRFLDTPVETLAQWLDWEGDIPEKQMMEAKRLVEEVRLLSWVQTQNTTQGVSPPPQFVWEQRCAFLIENRSVTDSCASAHRPSRSAAARKWLQRFRRRWDLVLGRQPSKDLLTVDTWRTMVKLFSIFWDTSGTATGSVLGSGKRTLFGVRK